MEGMLVITPHDLKERELVLRWFRKEDKIKFEWEETHSGDTDVYETTEITLGELYDLLNTIHTHEGRQKVLAGRELDTTIEKLREEAKRQQQENYKLREINEKYIELMREVAKVVEAPQQ